MKKKLLFGLLVLSLTLGVSSVKADDLNNVDYDLFYVLPSDFGSFSNTSEYKTFINSYSSTIVDAFESFYTWYEDYKEDFPYYYVTYQILEDETNGVPFIFSFSILTDPLSLNFDGTPITYNYNNYECYKNHSNNPLTCSFTTSNGVGETTTQSFYYTTIQNSRRFYANNYFFSNFYLYFNLGMPSVLGFEVKRSISGSQNLNSFDFEWIQESYSPIPSIYELFDFTFLEDYVDYEYTEVNLNDYEYVILSFKDYSHLINPATFEVKGQFCPSAVYNYGMTEKPYGVTDICTSNYQFFTSVDLYTTSEDLNNHVVYYLKAYDTSITNIIKVPTNIFNINYVSLENASNPTVIVAGRSYPAIPYDDLTSSATTNTEEGYIPGEVTNIFDLSSDSDFISNLFSNPLQTLGSVWTSIITMFALIGSFIGLLPITLQAFLYTGFSMAFILGIIKILL